MALNLLKLCVGATSIEDLQSWIEGRMAQKRAEGLAEEHIHVTRMMPKRMDELLDGGSLYWVIKGNIQVRERLVDIRPFTDKEGIRRCELVMDGKLIATRWQPRRAFQGWRYLTAEDAPGDLSGDEGIAALPPGLRNELAELGLL
ncbi:DUF1489 family protein [Salaquimonas pukyongi]|uniref:DUF1489 family protein n=1 Tax=Salaquimonas pukyongi TaxID=2712698 RepID=UPI00096B8AB2|nr:DUF1489 family protein [Salaquimonas pukyongi]